MTRARNHFLWIGPLVTFAGAVSYFLVFARFSVLRDFPWVNLPLVLLGLGLSAAGVWRACARSDVFRGRILGSLGAAVSLVLAGLFAWYIFFFSYQLPPAGAAAALHQVEPFILDDHTGRPFDLAIYQGRKVILVFYRGYW